MLRTLAILPLLLFATGCIHLQQVIEVRANGTADFDLYASIPVSTAETFITAPEAPYASAYGWLFDLETGSEHFQRIPGFSVNTYRVFDKDNRRYVRIQGRARNAEALLTHPAGGGWTWEQTAEHTTLTRKLPAPATEAADREAWLALAEGLRLRYILELPSPPRATNGEALEPRRIAWDFTAEALAPGTDSPQSLTISWP